ncbi:unnamed protein product [Eretmochelys imbricata]
MISEKKARNRRRRRQQKSLDMNGENCINCIYGEREARRRNSFIRGHTTRSIVYSQALRYNRICSNPSDRDKHLQDLYQAFLKLQYPPAEVKKQIDRARRVPRSHLLQDRPNKENNRTP